MENYFICLVSSYIHNVVRMDNQVLMASTKFNGKEMTTYIMRKMLNQMLGMQRRIQRPANHLRQSILRQQLMTIACKAFFCFLCLY